MKRTTILLPDDLAYLLDRERRRRGVSMAAIVREAIAAHFNVSDQSRRLPFVALGRSGLTDVGENFERYLDEEWGSDEFFNRTMGRYSEVAASASSEPDSLAGPHSGDQSDDGDAIVSVPPADRNDANAAPYGK